MPENKPHQTKPAVIFQVRAAEQLSVELAEQRPDYLYVPADVMAEDFDLLAPFTEKGCVPVAVLPRVVTDSEAPRVQALLEGLFDRGVNEALCGNLGHIMPPPRFATSFRKAASQSASVPSPTTLTVIPAREVLSSSA